MVDIPYIYLHCLITVKSVILMSRLCSEIRLVEILEGLCESSNFECNHMVEEHEEHFETWWFKRSRQIYHHTLQDHICDMCGVRGCLKLFCVYGSKENEAPRSS